jgi:hypothetical protein
MGAAELVIAEEALTNRRQRIGRGEDRRIVRELEQLPKALRREREEQIVFAGEVAVEGRGLYSTFSAILRMETLR